MSEGVFSRKLDAMGRIMIPVRLREQMNMESGTEYRFSTLEHNGRKYVCIDCGPAEDIDEMLKILESKGYKIVEDAN